VIAAGSARRVEPIADPSVSVVIPAHNEAANVGPLYEELRRVLEALDEPHEVLFVNDGSSDATLARLRAFQADDPVLRVIDLDGNFGEAAALTAGFHRARGEIVVTLDGDGQNDPADIPRLLDLLRTRKLDAVSGRRERRREHYWLRVLPSLIANRLIVRVTGVAVSDCGCGLKAYRRALVAGIQLPRGMNRFLPAILGVDPQAVGEIATRDRERYTGTSHYGIGRTAIVLRDLLALRWIIRNPFRAEVGFALATAGAAAMGALVAHATHVGMMAADLAAGVLAINWWNTRRFNRAQTTGVYRVRKEYR